MQRRLPFILLVLLSLALCAANIVFGNLNLDEGWYLNAALLVADGKEPYRDFFFTQAPFMPHVYALLSPLWRHFGVLGGRIVTAVFGYMAVILASLAVRGAVPANRRNLASLSVFALLACNIYHSYFTVIPKTYALASFFLSLGAFLLSRIDGGRGHSLRDRLLAIFAACAMVAATMTRLSLGVALAAAGLWLLLSARRLGFLWLFYGVAGFLVLGVVFPPIALNGPQDPFIFANFFHGARAGGGLSMAAGAVSRLARNYMPFALFALGAIFLRRKGFSLRSSLPPQTGLFAIIFAALFIIHILTPFPYDDYQVPGMPLLACAIVSVFLNALPEDDRVGRLLPSAILAIAVLFAFTSTINEDWFVARKDRFWVVMKKEPDLFKLREAGRVLREATDEGDCILTTDTYLAVEAGRPVPPGFEMGPFGYFPELSDKESAYYHVLNRNLLSETAASCGAKVAAFSGYSFAMAAPAMTQVPEDERAAIMADVTRGYRKTVAFPDFGQEHTRLEIWELKQ